MPCKCSSKRRNKITEQMQRRLFEVEQLKIVLSMKGKVPSSLTPNQLLDFHRKTHMLYEGNIKRKPVNKSFVNSIVDLHNKFVKEMQRRGMNHNTPLKKI